MDTNHKKSNISKSAKFIVSGGSLLFISVIILLINVATTSLQNIDDHVDDMIENSISKSTLVQTMVLAVTQEVMTITQLLKTTDEFSIMKIISGSSIEFTRAMDQFSDMELSNAEIQLLEKQASLITARHSINNNIKIMVNTGDVDEAVREIITTILPKTIMILAILNELEELIHRQVGGDAIDIDIIVHKGTSNMWIIGGGLLFVAICVGITISYRTREIENNLSYVACHDALTNILNRLGFTNILNKLIMENGNEEHSILFIDLDRFKIINDTCGHLAGDELLSSISKVFQRNIRKNDVLARLGGDEFGILLPNCELEKAKDIAQNIIIGCREFNFQWKNSNFNVTASIGIATISKSDTNIEHIMTLADDAMYNAKKNGRDQMYYLNLADSTCEFKQKNALTYLNQAITQKNFCLYSQRIKSLKGDDDYREVLVRMIGEHGEVIPPVEFIPLAEKYKLMCAIDMIVIEKLFQFINTQNDELPQYTINICGDTINRGVDFTNWLFEISTQYNIDPTLLCFEITETVAISNFATAKKVTADMRKWGCKIALDDFGTGVSSLTYLQELEFDVLKIDGYFIRDMISSPTKSALVRAIHDISTALDMKTVAEFVEDEQTEALLKAMGIDYAQGYGIEKPTPLC